MVLIDVLAIDDARYIFPRRISCKLVILLKTRAATTKETRLPRICPRGRSISTTLRRLLSRCHVNPNHVKPMHAISC
jgi:hypothetical protein